jgi:hypothetical protein
VSSSAVACCHCHPETRPGRNPALGPCDFAASRPARQLRPLSIRFFTFNCG